MEKQPTNIIDRPGVYNISNADHHKDPVVVPSVSASILKEFARSPRHGWFAHPRLNKDHQPKRKRIFDLGSAAHKIILGSDDQLVIIDARDYRGSAAQKERDAAYEADMIPVLLHEYDNVVAMAKAGRAQLDNHQDARDAFTRGVPERTLVWFDRGVWCRCRLDWLPCELDPDGKIIDGTVTSTFDDLKSTTNAHPADWPKSNLFGMDADIQLGMYRRGINAVLGIRNPTLRFIVQENKPPFNVSVFEMKNHEVDLADRRVERLLDQWRECLEADRWPGYSSSTYYVDAPPWIIAQREDEEALAKQYSDMGQNILHQMLTWQAPLPSADDDGDA